MHTDLTCKYRVLIWYILCFSFLHLFFRNPLKNYIKLQWPLRLLVNSGSLEGLNFLLYRILRKACQLKKNTSVNSRVIFINRKHQAHLKKKKKSYVHHSSAFKHCLYWVRKSFEASRTHENNYQLSSCIIKKDQYLLMVFIQNPSPARDWPAHVSVSTSFWPEGECGRKHIWEV